MAVREIELPRPDLRAGWRIFASRPVSLVAVLILAVVLAVTSFGLLAPPAAAAYYRAVRRSRRERFFIDLETVVETARSFVRGIRRLFLGGYLVAVLGLLPAAALLVAPVALFEALGREASPLTLTLQLLFLPAFFWAGAVLLYGYPFLAATGDGLGGLRRAWSAGRRHPIPPLLVGFLVLFPPTGAVFHLLMVFSYPLLAASAVAATGDEALPASEAGERPRRGYWMLMLLALATGGVLGARLAGGVGVVFWLGLWLAFLILTRMTGLGYGAGIFFFAVGYSAFLLGGLTIVARRWGEAAVGPWIAFAVVLLVVLLRRLRPVIYRQRSE